MTWLHAGQNGRPPIRKVHTAAVGTATDADRVVGERNVFCSLAVLFGLSCRLPDAGLTLGLAVQFVERADAGG